MQSRHCGAAVLNGSDKRHTSHDLQTFVCSHTYYTCHSVTVQLSSLLQTSLVVVVALAGSSLVAVLACTTVILSVPQGRSDCRRGLYMSHDVPSNITVNSNFTHILRPSSTRIVCLIETCPVTSWLFETALGTTTTTTTPILIKENSLLEWLRRKHRFTNHKNRAQLRTGWWRHRWESISMAGSFNRESPQENKFRLKLSNGAFLLF